MTTESLCFQYLHIRPIVYNFRPNFLFISYIKAYDYESDLFLKSRPYERIMVTDVNNIFTKAFVEMCNAEKVIKDFEKAGIFPTDPSVFHKEDFYKKQSLQRSEETYTFTDQMIEKTANVQPESLSSYSHLVPGCFQKPLWKWPRTNTTFQANVPVPIKTTYYSKETISTKRQKLKYVILKYTPFKSLLGEEHRKRVSKEADLEKRCTKKPQSAKKPNLSKNRQ